jgi:hypothetical protein
VKSIRQKLREICESGSTALWFSGGKDSRLLLEWMLADGLSFSILCFDEGWTREQRRTVDAVIGKYDLKVYTYLPARAHLFGDGDELTLAAHYAVGRGGETVPVLRDVVHDEKRCAIDEIKIRFDASGATPVFFENHVLGSKRREYHYAFGKREVVTAPEFALGGARMFSPLFFLSDNHVWKELGKIGVRNPGALPENLDTGNLPACTNCLLGTGEVYCPKTGAPIATVDWDKEKNLEAWREAERVK